MGIIADIMMREEVPVFVGIDNRVFGDEVERYWDRKCQEGSGPVVICRMTAADIKKYGEPKGGYVVEDYEPRTKRLDGTRKAGWFPVWVVRIGGWY